MDMNQMTLERLDKISKVVAVGDKNLGISMLTDLMISGAECSESFCTSCGITELCKEVTDDSIHLEFGSLTDTVIDLLKAFRGFVIRDVKDASHKNVAFFVNSMTHGPHQGIIDEEVYNELKAIYAEALGIEVRGSYEDYIDWIIADKPDFF
jgi:hypothetical protein